MHAKVLGLVMWSLAPAWCNLFYDLIAQLNEGTTMEAYTGRDLRERTDELIRCAEAGRLSVVTKDGVPVFIAVPFDDLLLKEGVGFALAAHLFDEERISLSQAARMAGRSVSEMIDLLGKYNISVIRETPSTLGQGLADFS